MNDDARRWIDLEGPPPPFIQDLFDAARDVEPLGPEEIEAMDRRFFAALAEQRRKQAEQQRQAERKHRNRLVLAGGAVASALAAAAVVVLFLVRDEAPLDSGAPRLELAAPAEPAGAPDAGVTELTPTPSKKAPRRPGARR